MWYLASVQFSKAYGTLVCGNCFSAGRTVMYNAPMYVFGIDTDGKQIYGKQIRIDEDGMVSQKGGM